MAKTHNTIIIISDDEEDEISTTITHRNKTTPIQKYGFSKTNPITLDIDDNDDDQQKASLTNPNTYTFLPSKYEMVELPSSSNSNITIELQPSASQPRIEMESDLSSPSESTLSIGHDPVNATTPTNVFDLSLDVLEYINNQHGIEPEIFMEDEPDWSYIAELGSTEHSTHWEPPEDEAPLPTETKIPAGMGLNEFLTRFDYYQHSVNQHINGLQPKLYKGKEGDDKTPSPGLSPTSSTSILPSPLTTGRSSLKRSTAMSNTFSPTGPGNKKWDHQAILGRLLDPSYSSTLQRPYVPVAVWQGSNWEDWAQFSPGDLIHVPFTTTEDNVIVKTAGRMMERRRKVADPMALVEDSAAWTDAAALLPGREPQDCCFRHMDIVNSKSHLFAKAQLVTSVKAPPKNLQNYYELLSSRQISRKVSMNKYHSVVWKNLSTENTVGGGSGDASCLLLEGDMSTTDDVQMIAGSLCDDNQSYNMEGNLREWKSSTGQVTQLKGHFSEVTTADGGTQVSWRTVHDLKTSNDKSLIFSASRDGKAKIWNRESRKLVATLVCHSAAVHQISVKPDADNVIATGSADGSGVIWKISDGGKNGEGLICSTEMIDDLDHCSVECLEFGHGPSDKILFMGYRTEIPDKLGWITAFDASTAEPLYNIHNMAGSVGCMAISQSGKYILSGNDSMEGGDKHLHVNDVNDGSSILKARTGHLDVNCVAFSRCDNYIASGSVSNQISIFDMRKLDKPVYEFLHDYSTQNNVRFISPDAGIGISGMYWMRDNNVLITAGGDCVVNLWDVCGGNGLLKSYKTADPIGCLAVNEDLHTLAAGASGSQGLVHIWRP